MIKGMKKKLLLITGLLVVFFTCGALAYDYPVRIDTFLQNGTATVSLNDLTEDKTAFASDQYCLVLYIGEKRDSEAVWVELDSRTYSAGELSDGKKIQFENVPNVMYAAAELWGKNDTEWNKIGSSLDRMEKFAAGSYKIDSEAVQQIFVQGGDIPEETHPQFCYRLEGEETRESGYYIWFDSTAMNLPDAAMLYELKTEFSQSQGSSWLKIMAPKNIFGKQPVISKLSYIDESEGAGIRLDVCGEIVKNIPKEEQESAQTAGTESGNPKGNEDSGESSENSKRFNENFGKQSGQKKNETSPDIQSEQPAPGKTDGEAESENAEKQLSGTSATVESESDKEDIKEDITENQTETEKAESETAESSVPEPDETNAAEVQTEAADEGDLEKQSETNAEAAPENAAAEDTVTEESTSPETEKPAQSAGEETAAASDKKATAAEEKQGHADPTAENAKQKAEEAVAAEEKLNSKNALAEDTKQKADEAAKAAEGAKAAVEKTAEETEVTAKAAGETETAAKAAGETEAAAKTAEETEAAAKAAEETPNTVEETQAAKEEPQIVKEEITEVPEKVTEKITEEQTETKAAEAGEEKDSGEPKAKRHLFGIFAGMNLIQMLAVLALLLALLIVLTVSKRNFGVKTRRLPASNPKEVDEEKTVDVDRTVDAKKK